jgi:hypothetical protein
MGTTNKGALFRMCYSAESSGGTFLFVVCVAAFIAFGKGQPALALLLIVLASMQVLEWIIWSSTPVCTPLNYVASSAIPVLLALQPTLLALILWWYEAGTASPHLYRGLFYFWCVATVVVIAHAALNPRLSCVAPSGKGHLDWDLDPSFSSPFQTAFQAVYYPTMGVLLLSLKQRFLGVTLGVVYFLSWVYYRIRYPKEWSSLWCHGINAGAVVAAIL